jgi:hypothetical protein
MLIIRKYCLTVFPGGWCNADKNKRKEKKEVNNDILV